MSERKNAATRLLPAIRQLAEQGLTSHRIGNQLGHHHKTIEKYAAANGIPIRGSIEGRRDKLETLRQLASEGNTTPEIARKLRLSQGAIVAFARRNGIEIRRQTKEELAARAVRGGGRGALRCPSWIPADYHDEYRDFAREIGPKLAERAVRRLMEGGL